MCMCMYVCICVMHLWVLTINGKRGWDWFCASFSRLIKSTPSAVLFIWLQTKSQMTFIEIDKSIHHYVYMYARMYVCMYVCRYLFSYGITYIKSKLERYTLVFIVVLMFTTTPTNWFTAHPLQPNPKHAPAISNNTSWAT